MPYTTLIITAGISALAPRNLLGLRLREAGSPVVFPPGKQNPEPAKGGTTDEAVIGACQEYCPESADPLDPTKVSAEYSLLAQLQREGRLTEGAVVFLVHTATLGGHLAVRLQTPLLERHLEVQVHAQPLAVPFDPSTPGGLALASGAFIGTISGLLKDKDPHTTAFAPIGGYKVMVALGHTAASFHGFPSLYLHEDHQVLQEIAPAPIAISHEVRDILSPAARRIGNGAEWRSLDDSDKAIVKKYPAFFTRVDDLVSLNELGQYIRLDTIPVLLSPDARGTLQIQKALLEGQLRQIRTIAVQDPEYPGINHILVNAGGRSPTWKLAQMGRGVRIAWKLTTDALLVRRIWTDHDQYEREAPALVTEEFSPSAITTWTSVEL